MGLNSPIKYQLAGPLKQGELDHTQGELARSYALCVGVHMSVENISYMSVENMCMCLCALDVCALCMLSLFCYWTASYC